MSIQRSASPTTPSLLERISVVLIARDSERTLARCLGSLDGFSDIVVYDNGSRDGTLDIARSFANVRIVQGRFEGFGPTRNRAAEQARHAHILALDTDEWLLPTAVDKLAGLHALPGDDRVIALRRDNFLAGRRLRGRPGREWVKRLYHRDHFHFQGQVHERLVDASGQRARALKLAAAMEHDAYASIGHLFEKRWRYAHPELHDGRGLHPALALGRGGWRFLRCYFLHYALIDGWRGLVFALAEGYGSFLKAAWAYEVECGRHGSRRR
ncbi:MAG: glycosyltransferase family 2 protein [Wenzhouxiangella sp.]|nr:MAG: glycosyltransferase family 2 protein [Wenzhouxiangella sp.]